MAKKKTPEGLDGLWDDDTEKAWKAMNPKHQSFLQEYLTNGNVGSDAYRKAYDSLSNPNVVSTCASQLLRTPNIAIFLDRLADSNKADLVYAKIKLRAAMEAFKPVYGKDSEGQPEKIEDIPDHKIIIDATDKLMKLNGEYIEKIEHSGTISIAEQILKAHKDKT